MEDLIPPACITMRVRAPCAALTAQPGGKQDQRRGYEGLMRGAVGQRHADAAAVSGPGRRTGTRCSRRVAWYVLTYLTQPLLAHQYLCVGVREGFLCLVFGVVIVVYIYIII